MTADDSQLSGAGRRPRGSQAFWTVVVALPAAFSLLRLWVEAGGQMQTALLLAENVSATNLLAAMFITGTRLVTMGLVAVFAVGGVLGLSADAAEAAGEPLRRRPLFTRWLDAAPLWFLSTTFVLAAATWQILYLPLLVPAFVATFQATPTYRALHRPQRLLAATAVLVVYAWTVWSALGAAWQGGEHFVLLMFALPPLLALMISDPVPTPLARLIALAAQPAVLLLLVWAALPVLTTPVLPLTVTTATSADGTPEFIRGHIIGSDDTMTSILQEHGGVRYLPNSMITARVLCPSPEELIVAAQAKPWFNAWYEALPIAGNPARFVGGTLRTRMRNTPAANNVHAKTGTLTSVSALSGYVTDADGRLLVSRSLGEAERLLILWPAASPTAARRPAFEKVPRLRGAVRPPGPGWRYGREVSCRRALLG